MWTCSLLKANAKQALGGRYWRGFWVCLVLSLVGGGGYTGSLNLSFRSDETTEESVRYALNQIPSAVLTASVIALVLIVLVSIVLAICWSLFLASPLRVGCCRYFMESRQGRTPFTSLFSIFRTPYLNVVKVQFLTGLKIVLGCLLLLIPGIYWAYCYVLVPYLLAENPYLTTTRAMELSKEIMYGEKWHYFVLELSFIGWNLLCVLTFGIGSFFLAPYKEATFAEFYAAMRSKAFSLGLSSPQELGGFVRYEI